jgi:hypothetical protein
VNQIYTPYQLKGLNKLLSFKPHFAQLQNNTAWKTGMQKQHPNLPREKVQEFTRIFCDHLLADTDYAVIQKEGVQYASPQQHIAHMQLDVLLKLLTYIIWTDRIVEGYFFTKIHDFTLTSLLERMEVLLQHGYSVA